MSKAEATVALQRFVDAGDYDMPQALPKRVKRKHAEDIVGRALEQPDPTERRLSRCGQLMRFYDLRPCAKGLSGLVNRPVDDAEAFALAIVVVELLGDMDGDEGGSKAMAEYRRLVAHALAGRHFGRLVDLFFHLPDGADPAWIKTPLERQMGELRPRMDQDDDAAVEYYALEDMLNDRLPTVLKAREARKATLAVPDAHRRRQQIGQFYLGLKRFAYVDMREWAMMMLQRDCNESAPEESARAFAEGLNMIMSRADARGALSPGDEADLKKYVTRCERGLQFYGGLPDGRQKVYVEEHSNPNQNDVLYWETETPGSPAGMTTLD